ncbi:hypothetical protein HDU88_001061 [Geranomyces variabilis]|nr:hypothetical protein HDU88_001061 [Geranomyces variabilis]
MNHNDDTNVNSEYDYDHHHSTSRQHLSGGTTTTSRAIGSDTFLALSAFALVMFAPVTSQYFVFLPWLRPLTTASMLVLGVFDVFVALLLINYWACYTTDPGKVKIGWEGAAEPHATAAPIAEVYNRDPSSMPVHRPPPPLAGSGQRQRDDDGTGTFCHLCNQRRPPRAHHCKRCKRCILRMDHHYNCIGFHNQPHFIRFLLYATLAAFYCVGLIMLRLLDVGRLAYLHAADPHLHGSPSPPPASEMLFMAVNLCLLVPVGSILILMLYQQVHNLTRNLTTIEYVEMKDDAIGIYVPVNRYDLGNAMANARAVMGPNLLLALVYSVPPQRATGHDFPTDMEGHH